MTRRLHSSVALRQEITAVSGTSCARCFLKTGGLRKAFARNAVRVADFG